MAPKGWTTVKLRAATRKRLDRLRSVMGKSSAGEQEEAVETNLTNLSYDGIVNLLVDEYYYRRLL